MRPKNMNEQEIYVYNGIHIATAKFHEESSERGWWDEVTQLEDADLVHLIKNIHATKLALIHSEISEALEGLRKDTMDEHLLNRKSIEVELADALIRIFDLAGHMDLDLAGAVIEKGRYNIIRVDHNKENRGRTDGKKF